MAWWVVRGRRPEVLRADRQGKSHALCKTNVFSYIRTFRVVLVRPINHGVTAQSSAC